MRIFATKYALTAGIQEVEGEISSNGLFCENGLYGRFFHGEGRDWHRTREAAVRRANQMRIAKIASLKKQLAKLESQAFR